MTTLTEVIPVDVKQVTKRLTEAVWVRLVSFVNYCLPKCLRNVKEGAKTVIICNAFNFHCSIHQFKNTNELIFQTANRMFYSKCLEADCSV